jgi:hypothetical protein
MTQAVQPGRERRPLRVGVFVDSLQQPRWVHALLSAIDASTFSTVALVVLADGAHRETTGVGQRAQRLLAQSQHWVYALYHELDDVLFPVRPDPFELTGIEPVIAGCPLLRITAPSGGPCDALADEDVSAILRYDLDVGVQLGRRIRGRALQVARYGVWACAPGVDDAPLTRSVGFREMIEGRPMTAATLHLLAPERDRDRVIGRSFARTDKRSAKGNRSFCSQRAAALVVRKLHDLYELGPAALADIQCEEPHDLAPRDRSDALPTNAEMLVSVARKGGRFVRSRIRQAGSFLQWFVAVRLHDETAATDDVPSLAGGDLQFIVPPPDRFWADPFPVCSGDRYYIFVEQYLYEQRKAHIAVIELHRDGTWKPPVPVLERPYHLSYPFVFRWRGDYFMYPETRESGGIELYRATAFPFAWELEATVLENVRAVDPTVVDAGGRWWMFANVAHAGMTDPSCWDDELHLYHAPTPLGPWTPHRRNPVKADLRGTRPAGRLFRLGGELYRPAQDCSERYGQAMTINRIVRIDPEDFREAVVSEIRPQWTPGLLRTHTINATHGLTGVDGQIRRRRRPPSL